MIGIGLLLGATALVGMGGAGLEFVGFTNNNTGNPAIHQDVKSGDFLVAAGFATTSAIPGVPTDWDDWAPDTGTPNGTGAACRLVTAVYEPGLAIAWSGASGARPMWAFRGAKRGKNAFVYAATGTGACAWPSLTLVKPSFIGIAGSKSGAQTDIGVVEPAGISWRTDPADRVTKNTSAAAIVRTSAALLEAFAPAAGAFDNTTGAHCLVAFSVEAG